MKVSNSANQREESDQPAAPPPTIRTRFLGGPESLGWVICGRGGVLVVDWSPLAQPSVYKQGISIVGRDRGIVGVWTYRRAARSVYICKVCQETALQDITLKLWELPRRRTPTAVAKPLLHRPLRIPLSFHYPSRHNIPEPAFARQPGRCAKGSSSQC
jgi:hypothetical protein